MEIISTRDGTAVREMPAVNYLLIICGILVLALSIYQIIGAEHGRRGWSTLVALVALGWATIFLLFSSIAARTPYLFTSGYVVCLSAFHLGVTALLGLGFIEVRDWEYGRLAPWLELAGWYTTASLSSIGIGFGIGYRRLVLDHRERELNLDELHTLDVVRWAGLGLLFPSVDFVWKSIVLF